MKIKYILTSTNEHTMYIDFIPMFIKIWKKLLPESVVKIILIAEKIPEEYKFYSENIILFKPVEGVSTTFSSQYIRLLYPSLFDCEEGILITDIDIVPMNRKYYVDNIKDIPEDKFVYYRDVLFDEKQIAMCYNVAKPSIWKEIFYINDINDVRERLRTEFNKIKYDNTHGGNGWFTDQQILYKNVMEWNIKTNNFVFIKDSESGFKRLDRNAFTLNKEIACSIKQGYFSDYHCYRPYKKYKLINDLISDFIN